MALRLFQRLAVWRYGVAKAPPYGVALVAFRCCQHLAGWRRSTYAIYTLRNPQRSHNISAILGRSRGKDEAEERALHLIKEVLPVSMLKITSTGIRITSNRHMNQYPVDVLYLHYFQLFRSDEINDPTLFLW
ncbi:uncharacterized protein LOC127260240 isoform X4 [Andrographis paniculata]|uniref:uncharacterized protein LOC127260240 isoform X4 n=1 Tax=Andrographis paniculata TaxID=175694 RepID=UPI0021E95FCE|nr:uncharacterized protein LOC127260240 isoform X4 [Andrographis paniculata]